MQIVLFAAQVFILLLMAAGVFAQAPPAATVGNRLGWDQAAATLGDASGFAYTLIVDGTRQAAPLAGVQCTGASSPFACSALFPALTPGDHQLELVAAVIVNGKPVESMPSSPFTVRVVVAPSAPTNLRVQ